MTVASTPQLAPAADWATNELRPRVLTTPEQVAFYINDLSAERLQEASDVSREFEFRVPAYYLKHVLLGTADDPLLDLVLPSAEELFDGEELWDATPSAYRASESTFWIQKYEYQGLMRLTTTCSGLCRFCYLKKKNQHPAIMSVGEVDRIFDDLERHGKALREIILSGGDPLCAPSDTLRQIGIRKRRLHELFGGVSPHIAIHTREPVWDPARMLEKESLWESLACIRPKVYMINVLHPREVTPEFTAVCERLGDSGGATGRPALLCQHPLFKGINDSVEILTELYSKLMSCSPPVLPYYMVHPFYNGTLERHRLTLRESQALYAELVRRPGCLVPRLVVPTPIGKCVLGPHEPLIETKGGYVLVTKDGQRVVVG